MRTVTNFNDGWLFEGREEVRLPHSAVELPFSYFDERVYQRPFTYEKRFTADAAWRGRDAVIVFDGVIANTRVELNGEVIAEHKDGYTPFEARLTDRLSDGENVLTVHIDGSENPEIPPFGGMIDYLTYAGIYRDVWLRVTDPVSLANVKIETPDVLAGNKIVRIMAELSNPNRVPLDGELTAVLKDATGTEIARTRSSVTGEKVEMSLEGLGSIRLWDVDSPVLYTLVLALETANGKDATSTRFGFRDVAFNTEGFWLNGRKLQLRGLNRHQSFPYAGYAMGRSAQIRDAEILKHELKLNMVRTSHYPQSTYFLDRCDEIGLLVFEEIPGWQHIGGQAWQAESVENVRRMIRRDWNHPSIVMWGVRINESADNHEFYLKTNAAARELDITRPTAGVRCITDSELLEDVYTMNDFMLGHEELGGNRPRTPLRPQREVTGLDHRVPYMVTEFNGHMYPTKSYDQEQRQAEHVRRHLEVLNAAYGDPEIAGAIGWCAFDYNTHKDFGSGDRICYHGVMDMFREPKFAAYVYASQCEPSEEVILKPVTLWARGERNIGGVLPLIILTNCDEVELQYGDNPPKRVVPDRENYPHLPHPPVVIDHRHVSQSEIGSWGWLWQHGTITGFLDGKTVATARFTADPKPTRLEVIADTSWVERHETVRVVVRVLDQAGNKLPYLFDPVTIALEGPAKLIGPDVVPVLGGSTGFWLRSTGAGPIQARVSHARIGSVTIDLTAR
ncbi:glycoside hydrolase family 2 protein [Pelagibacterium limicola]|uniref:glycoside hydrolase family 2 protein n=1 Tax=Pelagibacterium limicola TaxID=2791022 RepID=UPI0018AF7690|nr:glycoside hydrolase family 2 protein [Pelagibacterium limicola]